MSLDFYYINVNYLQFLHSIDQEVYYDVRYIQNKKPFLGIVLEVNGIKYFAPLTSPKSKHANWNLVSNHAILIYENANTKVNGEIYKKYNNIELHILSVIDFRKMIPVLDKHYKKISINNIKDLKYKSLLLRQYKFIKGIETKLIKRINYMYIKQIQSKKILPYHCDFKKLEQAMKNYQNR